MSNPSKGLGRGLEALFKSSGEKSGPESIKIVPIGQVRPNLRQPRRKYDDASLADLASSIKSQGVLQPILVRPIHGSNPECFEIVAGERRWRASNICGLTEMPVIVKMLTDMETLAVALIENLQRENLNPIEEALALRELKTEFGMSQEDLADRVGKSRPYIANALRLLQLPENVQDLLFESELSAGHARALLAVSDKEIQLEICRRILESRLSVREVEKLVAYWKENGKLPEADAPIPSSSTTSRKKNDSAVDHEVTELETCLTKFLDLKVKVAGNMTKGKLNIAFSSPAELDRLLNLIGLK